MVRGDRNIYIISFSLLLLLLVINNVIALEDVDSSSASSNEDVDNNIAQDTGDVDQPGGPNVQDSINVDGNVLSYDWLENKSKERNLNVEEESLAIIAFLGEGRRDAIISALVDSLKLKQSDQGCFPKEGCNVKETSLGTVALYLSGQDAESDKAKEWLMKAKTAGLRTGEWWLVVKSSGSGGCDIKLGERPAKTFNIENDELKEAPNKYYVELAQLNPTALRSLMPVLNVECAGLPGAILALLYKPDANTFFIQKSESAASVEFKLANVCFGRTQSGSQCDYEASAYATWALVEMGENLDDVGSTLYLQSKVQNTNSKQLALLNRILQKSGNVAVSFVNDLIKLQSNDGSWDRDVFTTSFSLFSLAGSSDATENVERASAYLDRKRNKNDGSYDNSVRNTAIALIALNGVDLASKNVAPPAVSVLGGSDVNGVSEFCDDLLDNDGDTFADCHDPDCENELVVLCNNNRQDDCEDDVDCGGFCGSCEGEESESETAAECKTDSECDEGEDCKRGKCLVKVGEETSDEELPPIEPKKSLLWLWILIIAVVVFGGGFALFYFKYVKTGKMSFGDLFGKKKKGPTFEEYKMQNAFKPARPSAPVGRSNSPFARPVNRPINRSKDEDALDKSIKEAQRIIKGK